MADLTPLEIEWLHKVRNTLLGPYWNDDRAFPATHWIYSFCSASWPAAQSLAEKLNLGSVTRSCHDIYEVISNAICQVS